MIKMRIFELSPLLPVAVMLIMGILTGGMFYGLLNLTYIVFILVLFVFLCFLFPKRRYLQTVFILLSIFLTGVISGHIADDSKHVDLPKGENTYKGVVSSMPVERGKTIVFDIILTEGLLTGKTVRVHLLKDSITNNHISLTVNTGMTFVSELKRPSNHINSDFDYASYLLNHGIVAQTFIYKTKWSYADISLLHLSMLQRARLLALKFRSNLLSELRSFDIHEDTYAIVSAMSLGDKSSISAKLRDVYSFSGVSHVLALSGLHLGIIYVLLSTLSFRRRYKYFGSILLICSVWAYVFLVGMMPSVVRSALMLSVMTLVGLTNRNPLSLNVLSFAAIIMLAVNPLNIYDVGFQLSFMAVGFIVGFHRLLNDIVPVKYQLTHSVTRWFWQMTIVSLLAQLGTMPLVIYYFGNMPLLALFANYIVIPCTTIILYLSVFLLLSAYIPLVGQVSVWLLDIVVGFQNAFLEMFSSIPLVSIHDIKINIPQVILIYLVLLMIMLLIGILRSSRK